MYSDAPLLLRREQFKYGYIKLVANADRADHNHHTADKRANYHYHDHPSN
jgi:hypothetical protein